VQERLLSEMSVDALLPTYNAHEWMVSPDAYEQHAALRDHFTVLSTTLDAEGAPYVSTVEGVQYPLFATQWHPEKPPYEFEDVTVPHTKTAIAAGFQAAQAFVDVARLNSHKVCSRLGLPTYVVICTVALQQEH
jgi:gamma-glutamyl hydrolase